MYGLGYDRNQVLVSRTEPKVQFWHRYWSRNFFLPYSCFVFKILFEIIICVLFHCVFCTHTPFHLYAA